MARWMLRGIVVLVRGDYSPLSLMTEWWGAGMVICLEPDADLHMAQLMPLPITLLLQVGFIFLVPDKGPLNGCVCDFYGL